MTREYKKIIFWGLSPKLSLERGGVCGRVAQAREECHENETDAGAGSGVLPRDQPDHGAAVLGGERGEGCADATDV